MRETEFRHNRRELLSRYHECELCRDVRGLEVHHKIPLSLGGDDSMDNLIVICGSCHAKLHNGTKKILTKIGVRKAQQNYAKRHMALNFYSHFNDMAVNGIRFDVEDVMDYLDENIFV